MLFIFISPYIGPQNTLLEQQTASAIPAPLWVVVPALCAACLSIRTFNFAPLPVVVLLYMYGKTNNNSHLQAASDNTQGVGQGLSG
jgi:hypothetical protein